MVLHFPLDSFYKKKSKFKKFSITWRKRKKKRGKMMTSCQRCHGVHFGQKFFKLKFNVLIILWVKVSEFLVKLWKNGSHLISSWDTPFVTVAQVIALKIRVCDPAISQQRIYITQCFFLPTGMALQTGTGRQFSSKAFVGQICCQSCRAQDSCMCFYLFVN